MTAIDFIEFTHIPPEEFLPVLNDQSVRKHLIDHEAFTPASIREWIHEKCAIDSLKGCRIRGIYIHGVLAGWCGIQPDENGFELAIVLSQQFWGVGRSVFTAVMCWADELEHKEVLFHLLDSRPEYRALKKISTKVRKTELLGRSFTTYYISVPKWHEKHSC